MSGPFVAVDTNILVYAHNSDSSWHGPARKALESLANAAQPWAIPRPCIHEFLAIATSPKIVPHADSMAQAIAAVEAWMESPSLCLLGGLRGHWPELKTMRYRKLARNTSGGPGRYRCSTRFGARPATHAPATAASVRYATQLPMPDFEDALHAAAVACGASHIATRCQSDFARSPVPALTPAALMARLG